MNNSSVEDIKNEEVEKMLDVEYDNLIKSKVVSDPELAPDPEDDIEILEPEFPKFDMAELMNLNKDELKGKLKSNLDMLNNFMSTGDESLDGMKNVINMMNGLMNNIEAGKPENRSSVNNAGINLSDFFDSSNGGGINNIFQNLFTSIINESDNLEDYVIDSENHNELELEDDDDDEEDDDEEEDDDDNEIMSSLQQSNAINDSNMHTEEEEDDEEDEDDDEEDDEETDDVIDDKQKEEMLKMMTTMISKLGLDIKTSNIEFDNFNLKELMSIVDNIEEKINK
jgi:hypothetical protein